MLHYDEKLAHSGFYVTKFEDRFFWDTPENLDQYDYGVKGNWKKYEGNPVLGGEYGTCFDLSVLQDNGVYKMWFSWRPKKCIAYSESKDGLHWSPPVEVLKPNPQSSWDRDELNRPTVIKVNDEYKMWYSGQMQPYRNEGMSSIGYAVSKDGLTWQRFTTPAIVPDQPWEMKAIMCPHVMYDERTQQYRMWYSGGGNHEPDSIGYAYSEDGVHWTKHTQNPVLEKNPDAPWEQNKVAGCQVFHYNDYYYMFYVGFFHVDRAAIGIARSKNGIDQWERCPLNPIIAPDADPRAFDNKAVYKPYVLRRDKGWMLWYNGAVYIPNSEHVVIEQIGVAYHDGEDFWGQ